MGVVQGSALPRWEAAKGQTPTPPERGRSGAGISALRAAPGVSSSVPQHGAQGR